MRYALRCLAISLALLVVISAVVGVDPPAPSFVFVTEKQLVVKSPPFTGKNDKVAKRNNTITLTETSVQMQKTGTGAKTSLRPQSVKTDTLFELTPDVVIRWQKLPELKDADGKTIKRSFDEIQKLKGTSGLPGFAAELKDLAPNQIVTVRLSKMKGSEGAAAEKLFVSRIIIQGEAPPPPEDPKRKKK